MGADGRRLHALLPMSYNGKGPGATCVNLMQAMARDAVACRLRLDVARRPIEGLEHASTLPPPFAFAPYRYLQRYLSPLSESRYLAELESGDVAYLWPPVSLRVHKAARDRGAPVLLEGINTRMGYAREILDAAYAELGAPPGHGITQRRIDEEDEKLALAAGVFCPSPATEEALRRFYGDDSRILPASYGVDLRGAAPRRRPAKPAGARARVLFVGSVCVRKGAHRLLEAWRRARPDAELWLVGEVEPVVRERFGDVLALDGVRATGFVEDVDALYREADVFVLPSLEEGDPLVTYEAAKHGLPLVVSPMGAGRMGGAAHPDVVIVDPNDPDSIAEALAGLIADPERRRALGDRMRDAVEDYSWEASGRRRSALFRERFGS